MVEMTDRPVMGEQREALRRYRALATLLLVAMGLIFLGLSWSGLEGFWANLARAGSEAALVGGLADWFAVTALFRRPLGLPIPHTAVIPRNKDRIGEGLGNFIERNFLDPRLVAARLRSAGLSARLGRWLTERSNAELISDRLVVILAFVVGSMNDQKVARLLQVMLRRRLGELELGPLLAALLEILKQHGMHQELFDAVVAALRRYVLEHREQIYEIVGERSEWWVPRRVDDRIARALTEGLIDYLDALRDRDHAARESFDLAIDRLSADLRKSPAYQARINALRDQFLSTPQVRDYFTALLAGIQANLEPELADPRSHLRQALAGLLRSIGAAVAEDREVQARMDQRIEEVVIALLEPWRESMGRFVSDVVRGWEASTIVDRVELAVGRDLQYIRVNGTVVGAAVGCALFLATDFAL